MRARLPDHAGPDVLSIQLASARLDYRRADSLIRVFDTSHRDELVWHLWGRSAMAAMELLWGKLDAASTHIHDAIVLSEQVGVPASALTGEVQLGLVDLIFRNDTAAALGRLQDAATRYPLAAIDSRNRPYLLIAQLLVLSGEIERAEAILTEFDEEVGSKERSFWEPVLREMQAIIDLGAGRVWDAIEGIRALPQATCDFCVLPYLGEAYDRAGQVDSTIAVLERYLTTSWADRYLIDPLKLVHVYETLARAYERVGDPARALECQRRIIDLWRDADPVLWPRLRVAQAAERRLSRLK